MKKKIIIISLLVLLLISTLLWIFLPRYLIKKDEKIEFLESYDVIELLYKEVMLENIMANNNVERSNESLLQIKNMYEDILDKSTEVDDVYILPQVMVINDYYGIDNDKYYNELDKFYIDDIGLFCVIPKNNFDIEHDMESAIDASILLLYYYDGTLFCDELMRRYPIVNSLEKIYNNSYDYNSQYLKENLGFVKARIADAFSECNIESSIDLTESKSEFEEDLNMLVRYYNSNAFKLTVSEYSSRNVLEKYEKIGFDNNELFELRNIVNSWDFDEIDKADWGLNKNMDLAAISEWIINLRREYHREDSILQNENFASMLSKSIDEFVEDSLIPQFTNYYGEFRQKEEYK